MGQWGIGFKFSVGAVAAVVKHEAMKTYGGLDPRTLNLGTRRRLVVSFNLRHFALGGDCIGEWMGRRAGSDAAET